MNEEQTFVFGKFVLFAFSGDSGMKEVATFLELRGSQRPAIEDVRMNDIYALIVMCYTLFF